MVRHGPSESPLPALVASAIERDATGPRRGGPAGRPARPPAEVRPASARDPGREGAQGGRVAPRIQVRRLPDPGAPGGRARAPPEPERARLDGQLPGRRRGRGAPAGQGRDGRWRGGRLPARRHHQLSGASAALHWRGPRSAHLHRLRPAPPEWPRPHRCPARGQEGAARAVAEGGRHECRTAQVQRSRRRLRSRVRRARLPDGSRGRHLQAARLGLSRRQNGGLAQDQVRAASRKS